MARATTFFLASALSLLPLAALALPPGLDTLRAGFANAVIAGNAGEASAIASFPLRNTAHDQPETLDQAAFEKQFASYQSLGNCLLTSAPMADDQHEGEYTIDCQGNLFNFGKRQGKWRYVGYQNINK